MAGKSGKNKYSVFRFFSVFAAGKIYFFIGAVLSFALLPLFSSDVRADFRVCNATQRKIGVAIGYRAKTGWISEGWWQIEPASCKALIDGDLSSRFYYLYAEDADGAERWNGAVNMCVSENEFKIDGVKNCFPRGFQKFGFREIDTKNQSSWMVQLTDAPPEKAASGAGKETVSAARKFSGAAHAGQTDVNKAGK